MIFPYIEAESIVQFLDKTRLNCVKSYASKDETKITLVEIEPEAGNGFIVLGDYSVPTAVPKPQDWFLDWQYLTAGTKVVTLRITTDGAPVTSTYSITCLTEVADLLWSSDHDLRAHEPDILKWVEVGRNSFKNIHRKAQTHILEWLDAQRIWRNDGTRLQKEDLKITSDVKELSTYLVLYFIFMGLQNQPDDVFAVKAKFYETKAEQTKQRGRIQADMNQDNEIDESESNDLKTFRMVRR